MSFFLRKGNKQQATRKKRKGDVGSKGTGNEVKKTRKEKDEDIDSDQEEEDTLKGRAESESESDREETAQEKKIKLAKKYLLEIEREEKERLEVEELDKSVISNRLRDEVLEQAGRLIRKVADTYKSPDLEGVRLLRNGHRLAITCSVVSNNGKHVFSGSKDCSLIKWCLESGKKLKVIPGGRKGTEEKHVGHTSSILSMAISSDSKFLASGCENKLIHIWNPETMQLIHMFRGHRGPVSGLAFRKTSHTLFSCSQDRSVKVWNLDEMSYVETLFGHQESITAIDSLTRDRAITAGGRDGSVRIWKIIEESQLVFQGHGESTDCVKFIDEQHFVSGGDDGSVCLWGLLKKKPLVTLTKAHGSGSSAANWITSLATLTNTDLFATGSQDGQIRLWKCSQDFKKVHPIFSIPVTGFVNSLQFSPDGGSLVAGVGQEHRLGRWWRIKEAKNRLLVIPLNREQS